ncbi:hypothetical protein [Acetobacter conturbans]|uniref:DUF2339 domain-containing protein n=1 Tax=Acetobacter conturbans TaxID=1737472 RepID=A0ABX0JZP2_9PROT|nr:hypothetical protein [Acetobacter conturbans]NHN87262.1 hypothetical protein [Acetobacter conturbans]
MSLAIPDWLPLWAQFLILGIGLVILVAFLLMPFAVYGVKGRLSEIELQLEDVRADLRVITMRLGALTSEAAEKPRKVVSAPKTEWTPPPAPEQAAEPEFRAQPPRPRATGLAPSPLLPPDILEMPSSVEPPKAAEPDQKPDIPQTPETAPRVFPAKRMDTSGGPVPVPRVSDAYEPGPVRPPELRATRPDAPPASDTGSGAGGRMPWHNAPKAPDNSRESDEEEPRGRVPDDKAGRPDRTEPVLRWPSRPTE